MAWYNLTKDPDFPTILTAVRAPEMAFEESTTERLCVCPTVSQCILALSALDGEFFIHRVEVDEPIEPDESVRDKGITCERWITKEVLELNGSSIDMPRIGRINITREMRLELKIAIPRFVPKGWEEKENLLYEVQDDLWVPRYLNSNDIEDLLR